MEDLEVKNSPNFPLSALISGEGGSADLSVGGEDREG